jgi:hypothetical protein
MRRSLLVKPLGASACGEKFLVRFLCFGSGLVAGCVTTRALLPGLRCRTTIGHAHVCAPLCLLVTT